MHDHKGTPLVQIAPLDVPKKVQHDQKPHDHSTKYLVGLDVGSTTVKAVVVDAANDQVLWQDYQRHETKQPEKSLEFLKRMEAEVGIDRHNTRMFMTGSGGTGIAEQIGAKFVQEVTAVFSGRREVTSRSLFGHRTWRPGRQDHCLQRRR